MPLLSICQVTKVYHNRTLLDEISFTIDAKDRLALFGSNGAGKTTLFRIIEGKVAPDSGEVLRHGNLITGYLAQNLEDQNADQSPLKSQEILELEKNLHRIEELLSEADISLHDKYLAEYALLRGRYEALGGYDFEQRMLETLSGLGLSAEDMERPLSSLSGGERMRVSLARLIVQSPDLLLLDEPTNHLDTKAIEWLEDYLQKYRGAVLLISHDRYFIDRIANKIIELENGKVTQYKGNYTAFCLQKEQFLKDQRQVVTKLEKEVERQLQVKQTMLSHRKMSSYHSREKVVAKLAAQLEAEKKKLTGGPLQMSFSFMPDKDDKPDQRLLLKAQNLSMAYEPTRPLFSDVSLEIKGTDKIVLVGANGCGKTTLLSILLGKIANFTGNVYVSGSAEFGYMGQFIPFADEEREILAELFSRTDLTETQARNLLARFGFREIDVYKKIKVLSGGERSRLYLCCLLQEKPDILFLDEPTNHLDIPSREILESALAEYQGAILAVSHDRYFIEKCAKRVLGFIDGKVQGFDSYESYRSFEKRQATVAPKKGEKTISPTHEKEATPTSKGVNRAKERRETALRKERIRFLEKEIEELDSQKALLEASFTADTKPEEYAQYATLCEQVENLYEEYINLSEEP